jgi:hypothetical protein
MEEQPDAPQPEPSAERSPKPPEAFPQTESVPLAAASPGVPALRPQAPMTEAQRPGVPEQPGPPAVQSQELPEKPHPA